MQPLRWMRRLRHSSQPIPANGQPRRAALRRKLHADWERFRCYLTGSWDPVESAGTRTTWLRPKGNLTRGELAVLIGIAIVPLLMVLVRSSAFPGVLSPGQSGTLLPSLGHDLNQLFSLHEIPASDRGHVMYLLFLPMGALLIALARLTFGLRVIGFRSILIAVGFQESGVVPSMVLIAVMVAIVIGVRPTLVRFRLPYYARVSVIMSISVVVLLGALLAAPLLRSEVLWGVGFFPVIVLGLLAEGIAKTLDRDNGLTAIWRTGMTIGIAILLAGVGQIPALREIAIRFPELVLTQIVAVIFVSEFLDLRLFQDWDAKLSGIALPRLFSSHEALRIALVRNHRRNGVIGGMGVPSRNGYSRYSVKRIRNALREAGHTVRVFEGDVTLLSKLRDFIAPHPRTGEPGGIVFNLAHGIQGDLPAAHVPSMLEMAGVAYTGPTPHGRHITLDRFLTATLLTQAGVRTPSPQIVSSASDIADDLRYPVVVKPRHAARYKLRIAKDRRQLEEALQAVIKRHGGEAVVEAYIEGRQIEAALIGNGPIECLPLVDSQPGNELQASPATLDARLTRRIRRAARKAFRACGCRDYALVGFRISRSGQPYVLDISDLDILEPGGAFERAGAAAGYGLRDLTLRIVDAALRRYRPSPAPPSLAIVASPRAQEPEGKAALER